MSWNSPCPTCIIIYATTLKFSLLIEWNLIRLGGHAHGIVTKTVHKTLPGCGGGQGGGVGRGVVERIDSNFGFVLNVNQMAKELVGGRGGGGG